MFKPIELDISAKETHYYSLSLASGQYVQINIRCWGINLRAALYHPSGRLDRESVCYQRGKISVSVITDAHGTYRVELGSLGEGSAGGHYEITTKERRKAAPHDLNNLLAEHAFNEAERLRTEWRPGSCLNAVKLYKTARNHWLIAGDHHAEILALNNIGLTYQAISQFEQAIAVFQQALSLSRSRHDWPAQTAILNNIGLLLSYIGDNQKAIIYANRALKLSQSLHDLTGEAIANYTLGDIYYGLGDIPKSLKHYRQALQTWQQLKDYRGQSEVLVSYGYAYIAMSDIKAASDAFNKALIISLTINDRYAETISRRANGNLQTKLGESQMAINFFLQSLEILKTLDNPHLKATVLGGLAYSYERAGEKWKALNYYEQALATFKSINHIWGVAESEMPIGEIYFALGENTKALEHYQQALLLFRSLKMVRWEAMTLRNMGLVFDSMGDQAQAFTYYRMSLKLTRTGQDHRYAAYTVSYIGRLYERRGNSLKGLAHFQRALQLSRVAVDPAGESLMLSNLAHLERDRGNLDKARAHIEDAIRIAETLRTKLASLDLRASYFASARQYYDLYIDILMRLHQQRPSDGLDIAAFEASEKARARSLLESLREARANIRQGVDPELLKQERELQQLLNAKAERHGRLVAGNQSAEAEAIAREITQLTTQHDQVKDKIKLTSPRYAALTQPQPLGLREIQQRVLDQDSVLLEYALGEDRSYLWAITKTEIASFTLPNRVEIENVVRRFYALITSRQKAPEEMLAQYQARIVRADAEQRMESENLSRMVLGAVAPKLARKRLLIVADGALQYIPFQALVLPPSGDAEPTPLISNYEVVNEPSASALALLLNETANRKPAPKAVAVLADPVFQANDPRVQSAGAKQIARAADQTSLSQTLRDVGNAGEIPRLFASKEEADAILAAAPWGSRFIATGFAANRTTATSSDLSRYRIVHFATHGFLNDEHPELSGIVLSLVDQKGQAQEGFLRLHDIYNLNLPAELVVLSACKTGLGRDVKGEGFIGLTRGFMYAGAAGVVASLWKVDDEATSELMGRFYTEMLRNGLPPAAALRESQLAMMKQKRWHSPYYWAGFVIQGQYARGVVAGNSWPPSVIYLASSGAAVVALLFVFILRRKRRTRNISPQSTNERR